MENRIIAFYLPQFHPIPENDQWWGKGFTEWTNVGKAKPLFKNHYQPKIPADLGYYDLRVPEVREEQALLAKKYGVEGFCYWHYWFGNGKRLLERPFDEVLNSKKPDFPFCLAWANESWRGFTHGVKNKETLIEQLYPGEEDYIEHFNAVLPAFKDKRYICVDDKPLFMIYQPLSHPQMQLFIDIWQRLAIKNGLKGIYFVAQVYSEDAIEECFNRGFDSVNIIRMFESIKFRSLWSKFITKIRHYILNSPIVVSYPEVSRKFIGQVEKNENVFPTIIPNWDHTPRTGRKGLVMHASSPESFADHLNDVKKVLDGKHNKIVFLKSWNEWAEGNYMEPDMKWGHEYLKTLHRILGLK